MSCIYCNYEGKCEMWFEEPRFEHIEKNCDKHGNCLVDDDPEPDCEDYDNGD